jgi:hypothetical protein
LIFGVMRSSKAREPRPALCRHSHHCFCAEFPMPIPRHLSAEISTHPEARSGHDNADYSDLRDSPPTPGPQAADALMQI